MERDLATGAPGRGRCARARAGDGPGQALLAEEVWSDGPPVAVLGVSDLVVVAAGGAVLVAPRARAQAVRELVDALKAGKAAPP